MNLLLDYKGEGEWCFLYMYESGAFV